MISVPAAKIYFPEGDRKEILAKIAEVLENGQLTLGKYGKEFEAKFAEYVGTRYAVTVNGGTAALEVMLRAYDIKGHTAIMPTNTFFATPAAVLHAGGKVAFTDISDDFCMNPESLKERITPDTKAVMVVHIGGIVSPNLKAIMEICEDKKLLLLEDAAHAQGSALDGKKAGSFGAAAAFSFYPTKVMTSGEGGMLTTSDEKVYRRALVLRDQGKPSFSSSTHVDMGYNWRMSEVHAILGIYQLSRLEEFIAARTMAARIYDAEFPKIKGMNTIRMPPGVRQNYYKYCALLDKGIDKAGFKKTLKEKYTVGFSGEVYDVPCHLQPVFKEMFGFRGGEFPKAEDLCARQVCAPVFGIITEEQARYVVSCVKEVLGQ